MKRRRTARHLLGWLALPMMLSAAILAAPKSGFSKTFPQQSDNTKMNKGDATSDATTADQQKINSGDRAITRKIRAEVMKDKSLSTYAHNIKIITQDGKVTLKGPVRTADEKATIEAKAATVAGADNVTSRIEVVPPKS